MKKLLEKIARYNEVSQLLKDLSGEKKDLQLNIINLMLRSKIDTAGNNEVGKATIIYKDVKTFLNGEPKEYIEARDRMYKAEDAAKKEKAEMLRIEQDAQEKGEVEIQKVVNYPKISKPKVS